MGVLLRERETDRVIGVELWKASGCLPSEVLEGLPEPVPAAHLGASDRRVD